VNPDFRHYVRQQLPPLAIRPERELEIVEELALQLEAAYDAARREGASTEEAWDKARSEIPDWPALAATLTQLETPRGGRLPPPGRSDTPPSIVRDLAGDVRYAVRRFRHSPGASAAATATLALALALGAAAFALVDGILIQPLGFPDASRLVLVRATVPPEGRPTDELTLPDIWDIAGMDVFSAVSAVLPFGGTTTTTDPPSRIEGFEVSPTLFDLLGVTMTLGRGFTPEDGMADRAAVAVIGHAQWQRMGAPADIIGRPITINEVPRTIVGVAPAGMTIDLLPQNRGDFFLPITRQHPLGTNRGLRASRGLARLADGQSVDSAASALASIGERLAAAYPDTNRGRTFLVESLQDAIVGPARPPLVWVSVLVGLVLLVATVNFTGLLMARTVGRLREMALRLALGAGRWRMVRESIVEASVTTLAGAALGAVLGRWMLAALVAVPELTVPRLAEAAMDGRTFAAMTAAALAIACVAGLVPLVLLKRLSPTASLRSGHETTSQPVVFVRSALMVGQTAFAFLLLAATVLLGSGLRALLAQPLGFETRNVVTLRMSVPDVRYRNRDETLQFFTRLLEDLRAHPAVQSAGVASNLPLAGNTGSTLTIQGREEVALALRPTVGWNWASPGYFEAIGMAIVRGRTFTDADRTGATHVTVINETLARQHFPNDDPIGRRVYFGGFGPGGPPEWHEIIGVVGDVRHRQLDAPPDARAYDLFGQHWGRTVSLVVRTADAPLQIAGLVRRLVSARDPQLAIFSVQTTADLVSRATAMRRLLLALVTLFAAIGLAVALVGLYGTIAYSVVQRTRELGVRLALGATAANIRRLVLTRGIAIAAFGITIGLTGLLAMRRTVEEQLAGLPATHAPSLAMAAGTLLVAATLACVVPAIRAARVNPADTLRSE
jgi:predicted permease